MSGRTPAVAALRRSLARTWQAFLGGFGGKPTRVQLEAMPVVLAGRDVLVEAPTASGKTEAVAMPLVERLLASADTASTLRVLYVVPTRALVNDLFRRLAVPLAELSVTLDRRTGDHPRPVGRRPPAVLLTTPESMDSLLCRHARTLATVEALVLDEVHLLEAGPRGDQAAVLVSRLRRLAAGAGHALQVCALSATAGSGERIRERFLVDGAHVKVAGARELELEVAPWPGVPLLGAAVREAAKRRGAKKLLAFVNRRQDAEELAGVLGAALPVGDAAFAHHGSLARSVRESVERRFLSARHAVVVATSTLELGIDVGDVDLVVLPAPPADVTSFLQRIGRGNRRTGGCQALAFARSPAEHAWLAFLTASARAEALYPEALPLRASVLAQQLVSLLYQNRGRWVTVQAVRERLPAWLAAEWPVERLGRLMAALVEAGLLATGPRGRLVATGALDREFEHGRVHSNIDAEPAGVSVLDELTREHLGTVAAPEPGTEPSALSLAGRGVRVVHAAPDALYVSGGATSGVSTYAPRPGPRKGYELCQAFRRHLHVPGERPVLVRAGNLRGLVHFGGTLASRVLATWLERRDFADFTQVSGLAVRFGARGGRALELPGRQEIEQLVEDLAGDLVRMIGGGPMARHLPRPEQIALARAAVQPERLAALCANGPEPGLELPEGIAYL